MAVNGANSYIDVSYVCTRDSFTIRRYDRLRVTAVRSAREPEVNGISFHSETTKPRFCLPGLKSARISPASATRDTCSSLTDRNDAAGY